MRFVKMQGAGNDFIFVDNTVERIPEGRFPALARVLCRRKLSLGADGLMAICAPEKGGDIRMAFYNDDGSLGEMCGNAARCLTSYALARGLGRDGRVVIETASGVVTGETVDGGLYKVRLNDPTLIDMRRKLDIKGKSVECDYIELGTPGHPHAAVLLPGFDDMDENELRELGRAIRFDGSFPKGANVTFCEVVDKDDIRVRTFERGVEDFTLACGTGSGATATALTLRGLVSGKNVRVRCPGGTLYVSLENNKGAVTGLTLTGPAVKVAEGEITDPAALAAAENGEGD